MYLYKIIDEKYHKFYLKLVHNRFFISYVKISNTFEIGTCNVKKILIIKLFRKINYALFQSFNADKRVPILYVITINR